MTLPVLSGLKADIDPETCDECCYNDPSRVERVERHGSRSSQ
ncbi:hypothetical protein GXM_05557 [Nostoc sphaeroides CCNUC1]|uniref:Uncharacterized protein n=1 Tax=Nostoc sphaeroides CCNUC1 TaxID=2653204 RepID=A0A5P8W5P6_9NOSO|nr:hypothetical protein GXM_05557 [Nostoc sphaeroides CCNUC1]